MSRPLAVGTLLGGLMATSLALRLGGLGSRLWMDEGISVGVASHPLRQIPSLLRADGSPPLYYFVLHGWMVVFGNTETATHALSLVVSLVAVPVAFWAGSSLFDRRTGWLFAVLVACSPYLSFFATETRMYALVSLLSMLTMASFLHAFAFGRHRYLWLFTPSFVLLLYAHNWGLWLLVGAVVALVPCAAVTADRRRFWLDAALSFGAVGLAYLPWLPTLRSQAAHTGAPWSVRPLPGQVVTVVAEVLGDPRERVLLVLLFVGGPALWALLRPRGPLSVPVVAIAALAVVPVIVGWAVAQISPSWAPRYLVVCAPAILLLAAVGLAQARVRGLVALGLILVFWVQPLARLSGVHPDGGQGDRGAEKSLAGALASGLRAGDMVVVMQMEEVPVLAYYLPKDLRFATALGPVRDPGIADWRDALDRMRTASVSGTVNPLLDAAPSGANIVLVCAQPGTGPSDLAWFALMDLHCRQWRTALEADSRFAPAPVGAVSPSSPDASRQLLRFTKRAG